MNSNWATGRPGEVARVAVSTVRKYLMRAEAAGLPWSLPADWDEAKLTATLLPRPDVAERRQRGAHRAELCRCGRAACRPLARATEFE